MTQPDQPGRRSPRRRSRSRTDSTHPAPTHPGGRRGGDRRPWPTASTTTRVSPGKPTTGTARSRSRDSSPAPTPPTVWTTDATPIDLTAPWPGALVERIVTSFSASGGRVVLLTWPTPDHLGPTLTSVTEDGVVRHAPGTELAGTELVDAVDTVERLGRAARAERVPLDPEATGPASRPFWADLVDGSGAAWGTVPTAPAVTAEAPFQDDETATVGGADLIITSLRPEHTGDHSDDHAADLVALFAARLLRVGGILAVLTHCDWTSGELTDPTGAVVTAGQNADLLYLQHIVAVHAPVRDGSFHTDTQHPHDHPDDPPQEPDHEARARHRALVRGLPAPHRRIHSDVLVFAQPHDHQPPHPRPPAALVDGGELR